MRPVRKLTLMLVLAGFASGGAAQLLPPRGSGTQAPVANPYQALAFFEGNWTIAGLPDGTRFDETCSWLSESQRHLVCRSRTQTASGVHEGLGVFSYRAADGVYVYRSFDPNGEVDVLEGRLVGDTWQFAGTSGSGPSTQRTRLTITPGGERSFVLTEEVATANGPWQARPQVRYVPNISATSAR